MPQQTIKSRSNPLVQTVRLIRDGKQKGFIFCEGLKLVDELLSSTFPITNIFYISKMESPLKKSIQASGKTHVPLILVDNNVMDALTDLETPAGVIALAKRNDEKKGEQAVSGDLFLFLPKVQLPQNLGAMIRSSEATGVNEIWLGPGSADPLSPKTIRGSTGSVFRVPVRRAVDLAEGIQIFKSSGVQVLGATQHGNKYYDQVDWTKPTALVLGAEGSGFSKDQENIFDQTIKIPMQGKVESLNLGTAAGICLFEAYRQRRSRGGPR